MAAAAGDERIVRRLPRLLAQAGERVKLAEDADHGTAAAIGAAEGGVDAAELLRHGKAQLPELPEIERRGGVFLQAQLRVLPDPVGNLLKIRGMAVEERRQALFVST